jgi:quinoprotein glucose dehydrogenase
VRDLRKFGPVDSSHPTPQAHLKIKLTENLAMSTSESRVPPHWLLRLTAALFLAAGLLLALPGARLVLLGGSLYYALAGAALVVAGGLLWRERVSGIWVFAGVLLATLGWALWEVGLDGWALVPRLALFVPLGVLLLVAGTRRSAAILPVGRFASGRTAYVATGLVLVAIVITALTAFGHTQSAGESEPNSVIPAPAATAPAAPASAVPAAGEGEWPAVGGSSHSQRFSGLEQITPANVSRLQLAWKVHLGMPTIAISVLEATPLMAGGMLYMCNMRNQVLALDPETGKTLWHFDQNIDASGIILNLCRGVAYYRQPGASGLCSARIISFAVDARMFALDAKTGERCPEFGANGEVDLREGMGAQEKGYYSPTSAPTIVRGKVIVGGMVADGQHTGEPSGAIRGFDAVTGKFAWAWDMGRPQDHGPPPPGQTFTLGTPNAWAPITGDDALGLAYVPLGNATPDYVSTYRSPAMNEYTDAVVAIDVETGALRWSFQTTHRDVWDYDVASPPTLVDFPTPQGLRPALIQPTKRGEFFVLDRLTGTPLVETVEKPVPHDAVSGETVSPTQPYPVGMPSFGSKRLTEADMWGISPFDQLWCRIKFKEARYEGEFTPIGLTPTIIYPGYLGGSEWAGVAVDPERHLMALNVSHFAMYDQMIPRAEADRMGLKPYKAGEPFDREFAPQMGTPYATRVRGFVSPLDVPCIQPPYTEMAVVDLNSRKTLWRQPLGTSRDSGPFNIRSMLPIRMGVPAVGGPLVTRSGLIFIAATQERTLRAFELSTGRLLWQDELPVGGHAAPMTYYSERSGRQFVVIPASGHFWMKSGRGDYLIAYALPCS